MLPSLFVFLRVGSILFLFHPLQACASSSSDEYNLVTNTQVCVNSENDHNECSSINLTDKNHSETTTNIQPETNSSPDEILADVNMDGRIQIDHVDKDAENDEENGNDAEAMNDVETEADENENEDDYAYEEEEEGEGEDYAYVEEEIFYTLHLNTWGKPQVVEGTESAVVRIRSRVNEIIEYMNNEVLVEEQYERIRPYCRNQNTLCTSWAAFGECESNPGYMIKTCSPACFTCEELDKIFDYEAAEEDDESELDPPEVEVEKGETVAIQWGVPQNLGVMFPDKVQTVLDETSKYMKEIVYVEDEYDEVFGECENREEDCSHWAALGECEKTPKYMKLYCAPACKSCEYLDFDVRCPIDPDEFVAWSKPGDLNGFFERVVNDPYWEENHGPITVISSPATGGPWVVTIDNFLSDEEAARLVEIGYEEGFTRSTDVGEVHFDGSVERVESAWRTSKNSWCPDECRTDAIVGPAHDRVERLTGIPYVHWEWWQLLRYEAGQYYNEHHDYVMHEYHKPQGPRILTGFFYLNDVKAGGGTRFTELDITVMPKKGRAVFWPSVLDEEPMERDDRTMHEALVVEAGVKYGANVWLHQRDIKTRFNDGCA